MKKNDVENLVMLIGLGILSLLLYCVLFLTLDLKDDTMLCAIVFIFVVLLGSFLVKQRCIDRFITSKVKWNAFIVVVVNAFIIIALCMLHVPLLESIVENTTSPELDKIMGYNVENIVTNFIHRTGISVVIFNMIFKALRYTTQNWKYLCCNIAYGDRVKHDDHSGVCLSGIIIRRDDDTFYIVDDRGEKQLFNMSELQYLSKL